MSIILKGIDLPKEGELTFIAVCNDGRAYKMAMPPTGVLRLGPYADLHQAIQIPKDHGRLIDESEIWFDHSVARSLDDGHNWDELVAAKDGICDAPTILEGEE